MLSYPSDLEWRGEWRMTTSQFQILGKKLVVTSTVCCQYQFIKEPDLTWRLFDVQPLEIFLYQNDFDPDYDFAKNWNDKRQRKDYLYRDL